jgi:hypothetical protein
VWGKAPNSQGQNAERFGSASLPFLSCKFFASQKTYETITAGLRAGHPWRIKTLEFVCDKLHLSAAGG